MDFIGRLNGIFRRAGAEPRETTALLNSTSPAALTTNRQTLRDAWGLMKPYWGTRDGRKSLPGVAGIITTAAARVGLAALNVAWWGGFINIAMQKDTSQIPFYLGLYGALLVGASLVDSWNFDFRQSVKIQWREHMGKEWSKKWLDKTDKPYYHAKSVGNPDHRMTEDVLWFVDDTIEMASEGLGHAMQLGTFIGILWGISGALNVPVAGHDFSIPHGLMWATVLTAAAGAWCVKKMADPLSGLYETERNYIATQREQLIRIQQNAESIAMMGGEDVERSVADRALENIARTWNRIVDRQTKIKRFTTGHDYFSRLVPYLALGGYFAGQIGWDKVAQAALSGERVQTSFGWLLVALPQFQRWKTFTQRITELSKAIDEAKAGGGKKTIVIKRDSKNDNIVLKNVTIAHPNGSGTLLENVNLTLEPGTRLMMTGVSGSGKTTSLRAVMGLYRAGSGEISLPENTFFIPQKAYMPNIPLRGILSYPEPDGAYSDEQMKEALREAGLPHLIPFLEQEHLRGEHYFATLSGGQQQRLRLASVLLHQPKVLFIDEGTSSLDEDSSLYFYNTLVKLLEEKLPRTIMWSVAHQRKLIPSHTVQGTLRNKGIDIAPIP
jgi:putative ATP-binding cassette transporter